LKNRFDVISIFPEYFKTLDISLIGKAKESGIIDIEVTDLRDFANGVHKSVDDTPYGGGAGMVMSAVPWGEAIDAVAAKKEGTHDLIVLTPAGKKLTQNMAAEFAKAEHLIFACGRYEGIDHRVTEFYASQKNFRVHEVSIGDYVLNGGEVATLAILETIIRLIPGVIGNPESLSEESHAIEVGLVEYPNYTKPAEWRGLEVPSVLLSGNHGEISKWRTEQSRNRSEKL
jgi:tRNA (guanine37-N1)-methyltransferase